MAAIIFFRTRDLEKISSFYQTRCKMELWLDQGGCRIFRSGEQLLGFCQREEADTGGTITFFFQTRAEVDEAYQHNRDLALDLPRENPAYRIYHFYGRDPEGRSIEFQSFDHSLPGYW